MIGKAYISTFQFYHNRNHRMAFKNRPVLIEEKADATDYVILPISRVINSAYLDSDYDFQITPQDVPLMKLS